MLQHTFYNCIGSFAVMKNFFKILLYIIQYFIFYFFIGTLMIPGQIAIVPRFLLLSHFPWPTRQVPMIPFTDFSFPAFSFVGTYWGVILPAAFSAFNFLLFKGFFDTLPSELIEAARIDGATELQTLRDLQARTARAHMRTA